MRTIKFRGKAHGRWIYGGLVYSDNIEPAIYFEVGNKVYKRIDWAYVDPATVGQFTGLLNKKGQEIYEGDILKMGNCDFRGVVQWHKNGYFYINEYYPKVIDDDYSPLGNMLRYDMEVIGNVYDNPELLKGGEK